MFAALTLRVCCWFVFLRGGAWVKLTLSAGERLVLCVTLTCASMLLPIGSPWLKVTVFMHYQSNPSALGSVLCALGVRKLGLFWEGSWLTPCRYDIAVSRLLQGCLALHRGDIYGLTVSCCRLEAVPGLTPYDVYLEPFWTCFCAGYT